MTPPSRTPGIHDPRNRWHTSARRYRLPPDWARRIAIVKARAHGRCQADRHAPGCDGIGTDCDHINPGDDNSLDNLQWLSHECHKAKTARESAQRNHEYKHERIHPRETNPGALT